MDINFALVLTVAVLVCFVLWLVDLAVLAPQRKKRVAELKQRFPAFAEAGSEDATRFEAAREAAEHEPVVIEYAKSFLPVLFIVLVLRSFVVEPFQIPSGSMKPTLQVGDFILVNKFAYGIRLPVLRTKIFNVGEPHRGDVMVFFPPHDSRYFIKRVIGVPGDVIRIQDKKLYINGKLAPQKLIAELPVGAPTYKLLDENLDGTRHLIRLDLYRSGKDGMTIHVKPGHYFMMGDNRDNSDDSRYWGQVPEKNIVGKAFAIWMHWPTLWSVPSFDRDGLIH